MITGAELTIRCRRSYETINVISLHVFVKYNNDEKAEVAQPDS